MPQLNLKTYGAVIAAEDKNLVRHLVLEVVPLLSVGVVHDCFELVSVR